MTREPSPLDQHVGSRIRFRRMLLRLSQEALAGKLGITFQQVQKYEGGKNRIGAGRLFEMARALGVEVQFFYEGAPVAQPDVSSGHEAAAIHSFLTSREGLALNRAFVRIVDPGLRAKVVNLVESMAAAGAP